MCTMVRPMCSSCGRLINVAPKRAVVSASLLCALANALLPMPQRMSIVSGVAPF